MPAVWEAEMEHTDLPYDVPYLRLEVGRARSHVRTGWLRSVCHIQQNFTVASFIDELAQAAGRDPLEFVLTALGDDRQLDMAALGLNNRAADPQLYPYDSGRLKNVLRRPQRNLAAQHQTTPRSGPGTRLLSVVSGLHRTCRRSRCEPAGTTQHSSSLVLTRFRYDCQS